MLSFYYVYKFVFTGMLYKRTVLGASGIDLIPNISFWTTLPGLIKDGYLFFISPCIGSRSEYDAYERIWFLWYRQPTATKTKTKANKKTNKTVLEKNIYIAIIIWVTFIWSQINIIAKQYASYDIHVCSCVISSQHPNNRHLFYSGKDSFIIRLWGWYIDTGHSRVMWRICFDLVIVVVNASEMCECYGNIIFNVDSVWCISKFTWIMWILIKRKWYRRRVWRY